MNPMDHISETRETLVERFGTDTRFTPISSALALADGEEKRKEANAIGHASACDDPSLGISRVLLPPPCPPKVDESVAIAVSVLY